MSRIVSRSVRTLVTTALALLAAQVLEAQRGMVSISGAVRDESGAALPGIRVSATREGVSDARAVITTTDATGEFRFINLPPGNYTVDVNVPGFRRVNRTGVNVTRGRAMRLNVRLETFVATAPPTGTPAPPPRPPVVVAPIPKPVPSPAPPPSPPPAPVPDKPGGGGGVTEPASPFDPIKTFVSQMQSAAGLLKAEPNRIELGQRVDVSLTISPSSSATELLQRLQTPDSVVDAREAKIAPRMRAQLIVPAGTAVAAVGSEERAVSNAEDTIWRWVVTPGDEGELPISARLSAPVVIDGKEAPYDVRTFEASVTVVVRPVTRIRDFVANHWQWLWTAIIVPVFIWWRRRSSKVKSG
jgi:Carboxypeptidase regulatory-like domain